MNRDDIIRMAREVADVETDSRGRETFSFDCYGLERFAALAVADRDALRHRVRELEEAMRLCGIDHSSLIRIATAIRGSAP